MKICNLFEQQDHLRVYLLMHFNQRICGIYSITDVPPLSEHQLYLLLAKSFPEERVTVDCVQMWVDVANICSVTNNSKYINNASLIAKSHASTCTWMQFVDIIGTYKTDDFVD